jgi:DNA-binding transcriptional LysR family regulator
LDNLHQALEAFGVSHTALAGTLQVSLTNSHGKFYVLPQLPRFFEMYPNIRLEIGFSDVRDHLVAAGFDAGTCYGQPDDANYVSRVICRPQLLAVASPAYLAQRGTPQVPQDLVAHNCINSRLGAGPSASWAFLLNGSIDYVHHPDDRVVIFDQIEGVGQAAVAGLGVTVCHALAVLSYLRSGALRCVLPEYQIRAHEDRGDVYVYFPHRAHIAARVRAFVDFLVECPREEIVDAGAFSATSL